MGCKCTDSDLRDMLKAVDSDPENCKISEEQFVKLITQRVSVEDSSDQVVKAFKVFEADGGKGYHFLFPFLVFLGNP